MCFTVVINLQYRRQLHPRLRSAASNFCALVTIIAQMPCATMCRRQYLPSCRVSRARIGRGRERTGNGGALRRDLRTRLRRAWRGGDDSSKRPHLCTAAIMLSGGRKQGSEPVRCQVTMGGVRSGSEAAQIQGSRHAGRLWPSHCRPGAAAAAGGSAEVGRSCRLCA